MRLDARKRMTRPRKSRRQKEKEDDAPTRYMIAILHGILFGQTNRRQPFNLVHVAKGAIVRTVGSVSSRVKTGPTELPSRSRFLPGFRGQVANAPQAGSAIRSATGARCLEHIPRHDPETAALHVRLVIRTPLEGEALRTGEGRQVRVRRLGHEWMLHAGASSHRIPGMTPSRKIRLTDYASCAG